MRLYWELLPQWAGHNLSRIIRKIRVYDLETSYDHWVIFLKKSIFVVQPYCIVVKHQESFRKVHVGHINIQKRYDTQEEPNWEVLKFALCRPFSKWSVQYTIVRSKCSYTIILVIFNPTNGAGGRFCPPFFIFAITFERTDFLTPTLRKFSQNLLRNALKHILGPKFFLPVTLYGSFHQGGEILNF